MPVKRLLAAAAILVATSGAALAQSCTFTMPNINFGTLDLTAATNYRTTAIFVSNCTGTAGRSILVCPNFNAGTGGVNGTGSIRYMLNGANQLQYNIYRNNAYTTVWGSRTWGLPPTPPTVTVNLNGAGTGTRNQTARVQVPLGQGALPAGLYTSSFAGIQAEVNYDYSGGGRSCTTISAANTNSTPLPFTVSATAGALCTITATDLNFGTATLLNSNVDTTNTISVRCPSGLPYTVGLDGGGAGTTNPTLRELDNGIDQIIYGIYTNAARTTGWSNSTTLGGTGNGAFQNYTAYGRIAPQVTPAADTYTDTIVVTVTY